MVVLGESDAEAFLAVMRRAVGELAIGAATRADLGIVVGSRQGPSATEDLRILLDTLRVRIILVDHRQAAAAVDAWRRFDKGRHSAGLNLGYCFSSPAPWPAEEVDNQRIWSG